MWSHPDMLVRAAVHSTGPLARHEGITDIGSSETSDLNHKSDKFWRLWKVLHSFPQTLWLWRQWLIASSVCAVYLFPVIFLSNLCLYKFFHFYILQRQLLVSGGIFLFCFWCFFCSCWCWRVCMYLFNLKIIFEWICCSSDSRLWFRQFCHKMQPWPHFNQDNLL